MPADNNLIIKASGALTTTTTGSEVNLGTRVLQPLRFRLNVSAITGATGTLSVKLQHASTTSGTYTDLGTFDSFTTAVGQDWINARPKQFVKYVATLSGTTPNFTCAIDVVPAAEYNLL